MTTALLALSLAAGCSSNPQSRLTSDREMSSPTISTTTSINRVNDVNDGVTTTSPTAVPIAAAGTVGTTMTGPGQRGSTVPTPVGVPTTSSQSVATVPFPVAPAGAIEQMIRAAWPEDPDRAVRIAKCESGLRPNARNGPHAGLLQINVQIHAKRIARMGFTVEQMFEAAPNIAVARALWLESGWRPWSCR